MKKSQIDLKEGENRVNRIQYMSYRKARRRK